MNILDIILLVTRVDAGPVMVAGCLSLINDEIMFGDASLQLPWASRHASWSGLALQFAFALYCAGSRSLYYFSS